MASTVSREAASEVGHASRGAPDHADRDRIERALISARREACGLPTAGAGEGGGTVGLALSGGGIRSATFSLGVLQALAAAGILRRFDYISTVSGGGYTGGFLGALLRAPARATRASSADAVRRGYALVESVLAGDAGKPELEIDDDVVPGRRTIFHPIRWLREAGRYLAPTRSNDWLYAIGYYLRSLAAVHYVAAVALVVLFCVWIAFLRVIAPHELGNRSPMWAAVAVTAFATAAVALAYWPTTWKRHGRDARFQSWVGNGQLVFFAAAGLGGAALMPERPIEVDGSSLRLLLLVLGVLCAVAFVILVLARWHAPQLERTRRRLTRWLTTCLFWTLVLALFAGVDTLARTVYRDEGGFAQELYSSALALLLLAGGALRAVQPDQGKGIALAFVRYASTIALLLALGICIGLATAYGMVVYAAHDPKSWSGLPAPLGVPLAAWLLTGFALVAIVGLFLTPAFLNLSTFHNLYAARVTRAFLGAANFARLGDQEAGMLRRAAWVQQTHPDDLWTLEEYYGLDPGNGGVRDAASACYPIHLVNMTLNEQRGGTSDITQRDRKGVCVTLGPAGMAVERQFHAWSRAAADPVARGQGERASRREGASLVEAVRDLKLGNWLAISGAAFSSGVGAQTRLGLAMIATLFNVRMGYWWEPPVVLREQVAPSLLERLKRNSTFACLFAELTGGFWGRWSDRWYLSDGAHFENTGLYALIERRVGFIVACDNGADPRFEFRDWGNLVRKARIDLGASITVLEAAGLDRHLPASLRPHFGGLADFAAPANRRAPEQRCAMLARVTFDNAPDAAPLTLLLLKPALVANLPGDLVDYAVRRDRFPHESTRDQFFDEEQWESYRALGRTIGGLVFAPPEGSDAWAPRGLMPLPPAAE